MGARKYVERTIDVTSFRDVRNVSLSLHVTEEQLKEAVAVVGPMLADVREHLKSYHSPILHRPSKRGWRM